MNHTQIFSKCLSHARKILYKKYKNSKRLYNIMQINYLVYQKKSHIYNEFKEEIQYNKAKEQLSKYYNLKVIKQKFPQLSDYYKNYLEFFSKPFYINKYFNNLILNYGEEKAEVFYIENYSQSKSKTKSSFLNIEDIDDLTSAYFSSYSEKTEKNLKGNQNKKNDDIEKCIKGKKEQNRRNNKYTKDKLYRIFDTSVKKLIDEKDMSNDNLNSILSTIHMYKEENEEGKDPLFDQDDFFTIKTSEGINDTNEEMRKAIQNLTPENKDKDINVDRKNNKIIIKSNFKFEDFCDYMYIPTSQDKINLKSNKTFNIKGNNKIIKSNTLANLNINNNQIGYYKKKGLFKREKNNSSPLINVNLYKTHNKKKQNTSNVTKSNIILNTNNTIQNKTINTNNKNYNNYNYAIAKTSISTKNNSKEHLLENTISTSNLLNSNLMNTNLNMKNNKKSKSSSKPMFGNINHNNILFSDIYKKENKKSMCNLYKKNLSNGNLLKNTKSLNNLQLQGSSSGKNMSLSIYNNYSTNKLNNVNNGYINTVFSYKKGGIGSFINNISDINNNNININNNVSNEGVSKLYNKIFKNSFDIKNKLNKNKNKNKISKRKSKNIFLMSSKNENGSNTNFSSNICSMSNISNINNNNNSGLKINKISINTNNQMQNNNQLNKINNKNLIKPKNKNPTISTYNTKGTNNSKLISSIRGHSIGSVNTFNNINNSNTNNTMNSRIHTVYPISHKGNKGFNSPIRFNNISYGSNINNTLRPPLSKTIKSPKSNNNNSNNGILSNNKKKTKEKLIEKDVMAKNNNSNNNTLKSIFNNTMKSSKNSNTLRNNKDIHLFNSPNNTKFINSFNIKGNNFINSPINSGNTKLNFISNNSCHNRNKTTRRKTYTNNTSRSKINRTCSVNNIYNSNFNSNRIVNDTILHKNNSGVNINNNKLFYNGLFNNGFLTTKNSNSNKIKIYNYKSPPLSRSKSNKKINIITSLRDECL